MCLDKIEEQESEIEVLTRELARTQAALTLISEGLGVLDIMASVARPSEFETLFKDYAPFKNIMAVHFPKQKKERKKAIANDTN